MEILSKEKVNCKRQHEVDYLRGFTALNLIIVHVGLYLGSPENIGLYTFCDIYGSELAAPILMALMGLSIVFSSHQKPTEMLKRGIKLFILGYILNAYRSIVPMLIWGSIDEWATIEAFFVVDILPFAGLSFMLIALLKKFKLSNVVILIISIIMVFINQLIMLPTCVPWSSKLLTGIVNLFCPVTNWSCFPFLTWFFFPAFGMVFGDMLSHCTDKKKLYAILLPVGLLCVLYVYYQFHCLYPNYTSYYYGDNFYYMGVKNVLLTAGFVCFLLAFWFFTGRILPSVVKRSLVFLSKNLNLFYIISWAIIAMLMHLQAIYKWNLNVGETILVMALVEIICAALTRLCLILKTQFKK